MVVNLLQELVNRSARFGQVAILAAMHFLVFERLHERLARALWLQPSTTPDASGLNRRFRIIRPFHPWSGQDFELVTYLHTWGEHRVYFHKEGEHLVPVPATWTDILAEDPVVQLAAGRSLFRAMDLLELAELLEGLRGRHVKEITP